MVKKISKNRSRVGIIYKTTNKLTKKVYIGQHWVKDIKTMDEEYWGSGTNLQFEMKRLPVWLRKKYYIREVLCVCETQEELDKKEKEYVNEEFLARPDTMNKKLGG